MNPPSANQGAPSAINPSKRRRRWGWVVLILVLIMSAAAAYFLWRSRTPAVPATGQPAVAGATAQPGGPGGPGGGRRGGAGGQRAPVVVAVARLADVDILLPGLGTVSATNTVTVRPRVEGQLLRVLFREGQMVRQGELLAEIDPRPFQVQVSQAEGQVARDQAQLRAAQVDLERYKVLLAQDSIAAQQIDTQQALVRQLEGTLKINQSSLEGAKLQLSYTRVMAPMAGRIGLRQVDAGNIIRPSDANGLVVITQLQPATVFFSVPEDHVPAIMKQLRAGTRMPVAAWDRDQKNLLANGALLTLDNQIDPATGTIKLKAQFPNADGALFPNQFVNARLLLDVRRDAIVVPTSAIQRGSQGIFVYVVKDDQTVTARVVTPGPVQGMNTAIDAGVAVGERVVVDGTDRLREGMRVEAIVRAPPAQRGPGNQRRQRRDGAGAAAGAGAPAAGQRGGQPADARPPGGRREGGAPAAPGAGAAGAPGAGAGGPMTPERAERIRQRREAMGATGAEGAAGAGAGGPMTPERAERIRLRREAMGLAPGATPPGATGDAANRRRPPAAGVPAATPAP